MAEWLRPVFSRAKTPVPGVTATFERQTSSSIDESLPDIEEVPNSKLRPSSRVSSYIGFPVRPSTPPFPGVQEAFQNARDPEFLYHKPSGDQMAETLKVVMMTRYNIHPLPVQYNSCILHVLEAYQDLREQVDAKDKIIEQLTQDHTKDIQTFEELATKWEFKERDYKIEMKKLEVLLSKTEGGMETVVMARSNSRVHGSTRASDEIGRHFSTIKDRHRQRSLQSQMDQQAQIENLDPVPQFPNPNAIHSSGISHSQLEALDKHQNAHDRGRASFEGFSGTEASTESMMSQDFMSPGEGAAGLGSIMEEKPLPEIPAERSTLRRTKTVKARELAPPTPDKEMSFSFQPGDDSNALTREQGDEITNAHKVVLEDLQRRFEASEERSETSMSTTSTRRSPERSSEPTPSNKLRPDSRRFVAHSGPVSPYVQCSVHDYMSRGDSTSSVVTVVRDNSGRSSASGSRNESRNNRPHLDRNHSTSEAITAAARAYVASNAKSRHNSATPGDRSPVEELVKSLGGSERKDLGPRISMLRDSDRL